MKKSFIIIFFTACSFTWGQNIPQLYKKCLPAIVKISVLHYDGTASRGTGFFISENTVVTCYHVADNVNTIEIQNSKGKSFTVDSVVSSNRATDLIKFTVKEKSKSWLKLSDKLPNIGEGVFIIGNPDDYDFSISDGIISGLRLKNAVQVIQTTAPCSPGNSGSPVLDKNGKVIGVMSFVKFIGQNLNFAATSLNLISITNDKTIKSLVPVAAMISSWEKDSIINQAKSFYKKQNYKKTLSTILPITKWFDTEQSLEFTEIIGNCYFYLEDYSTAAQYYEHLMKTLQAINKNTPDNIWIYAQALHNTSVCYFVLGDKDAALSFIAKAVDVCTTGLQSDSLRKEVYTVLIQQVYAADACYKYALNKLFEACLSWKIAKQYGYTKDDYGLEAICK